MLYGWVYYLLLREVIMKVHCAWCEKAGRDPYMGEKEPMDSDAISHGMCKRCEEDMMEQTANMLGPKKPTSNPSRRKYQRR